MTLNLSPAAAPKISECDVAIVGCGPTGAALANLLGQAGLSVCIVERAVGVQPLPRAIHIDGETMRVFQSMGMASRLLSILRPGGSMHWVNARNETLLVRSGVVGLCDHGWHNDYYFHQPDLEALLREGFRRFDTVSLREGQTVVDLQQDGQDVNLALQAEAGGARSTLRARYVVGCDGARSTVRRWCGGDDFEDLGEHQAWIVVDGVLERPLDLPEHSVQHCDPARPATSIYVHALRRRWELMLLPGEDPRAMVEPEQLWPMLTRWVQPSQVKLERAATYVFHSLVARRWQEGRLFLAGDSAHQTPPFLGQGLCAGIRDAANLGWKLVQAVRHPDSARAVLDTYGPERTPHAREFIALAVEVGRVIQVTDPAAAQERDARLLEQGMRFTFPTPHLGEGLHRARPDRTAVGRIVPQFEVPDGRWSDDVAGPAWSLLLDARGARWLASPEAAPERQRLQTLGVVLLAEPGERALAWLASQQGCAALLRPDRYLADLCADPGELEATLDWLERTACSA